jgi:RND family efflux transporter MFP subunit
MKRVRIVLLAGIAALSLTATACSSKKEEETLPPRPVLSVVVEPVFLHSVKTVGFVAPRYTTDLAFRVAGRLTERTVHVGDILQPNQTIATIDPLRLDLAVKSASADLASAQAQLTNARTNADRQRALLAANATAQATVDTAEQTLAAAQASVVRAEAALKKANDQLGYAVLKSEFAGVVTATNAEVGQVVSPGQSVLTVARSDVREAVIDMPHDEVQRLRAGQHFDVALQLDPEIKVTGKVREIAPQADAATRTQRIRISLDAPPDSFRLGTTIIASPSADEVDRLLIPATALLQKDDKSFVWVVEPKDGKLAVALREVEAVEASSQRFEIRSGLARGTRIVTAGVHTLEPGQIVRLYGSHE